MNSRTLVRSGSCLLIAAAMTLIACSQTSVVPDEPLPPPDPPTYVKLSSEQCAGLGYSEACVLMDMNSLEEGERYFRRKLNACYHLAGEEVAADLRDETPARAELERRDADELCDGHPELDHCAAAGLTELARYGFWYQEATARCENRLSEDDAATFETSFP